MTKLIFEEDESKNQSVVTERDEKWLENIQQDSWNPEIIISGLSLAFILAFPNSIYTYVISLIQDTGISFLAGSLILFYSLILVNVFKVFLIVHLSLRFVWAGLLGINYAFPKGVIEEKLFDHQKELKFLDTRVMVINLERICSMAFGIPISLAMMFIPVTLFLGGLVGIYIYFDLEFYVMYLIFLGSLFGIMIYGLMAKKWNIKRTGSNYLATISAIYTSNIGKWKYNLLQFSLFIITTPFVFKDAKDFSFFFNDVNTSDDRLEWPIKSWYYQDQRNAEDRFPKILLPSEVVKGDKLNIHVAHYQEDNKNILRLNKHHKYSLDTAKWQKLTEIKDLYQIYLNDTLISTGTWSKGRLQSSLQRVHSTSIDISNLAKGVHEIRLKKALLRMPMFDKGGLKIRNKWAVVRFEKV
jgi:hypothetical protein